MTLARETEMNRLDALCMDPARDPQGMEQAIASLPGQCTEAWELVQGLPLPEGYRRAESVIILGMGGSAIGGALLRSLVEAECPVPVIVNRDYGVPGWVGPRTLAIASSYSGDTEETLAAFDGCLARGAMTVALASGGRLRDRAQGHGPFFQVTYRGQPRAALGYSLIPLVGIFQRLGLIRDKSEDISEATTVMEGWQREISPSVPASRNAAKQLALGLHGKVPVVYGAAHLSEVARRWKGQVSENAKGFAASDVLPELNHNAVVGYERPENASEHIVVVLLRSDLYHPRVALRCDITAELLRQRGLRCADVAARGRSPLAQMLSAIHFGDYVSFYLGLLNGVDPSSVDAIRYVKGRLAEA